PFRGGLSPRHVERALATYRSVQTFTIQSAFKYDHSPEDVRSGIAAIAAHVRETAIPFGREPRAPALLDRLVVRYQAEVAELAGLVNAVARAVPRRRLRKLHVGLFGYSRATESGGSQMTELIVRAAALRHFLG